MSADSIDFTITRSGVYWHFSGEVGIMDLTSGLTDSYPQPMIGTSGYVGYLGYSGHQYALNFYGNLYFTAHGTAELFERCDGYHVWMVPVS